jgi:hypothetical protein
VPQKLIGNAKRIRCNSQPFTVVPPNGSALSRKGATRKPADDARRSVLRARALDAVGRGTEATIPAVAEGVRRIKEKEPVKLPKPPAVP